MKYIVWEDFGNDGVDATLVAGTPHKQHRLTGDPESSVEKFKSNLTNGSRTGLEFDDENLSIQGVNYKLSKRIYV
jgi:RNase H-fold protein (predicted Holliday junction resolvase)